jgi:hypothetical protein
MCTINLLLLQQLEQRQQFQAQNIALLKLISV